MQREEKWWEAFCWSNVAQRCFNQSPVSYRSRRRWLTAVVMMMMMMVMMVMKERAGEPRVGGELCHLIMSVLQRGQQERTNEQRAFNHPSSSKDSHGVNKQSAGSKRGPRACRRSLLLCSAVVCVVAERTDVYRLRFPDLSLIHI